MPQWRISAWSFIDNVPMIIGSFGATAVLVYGAIESPLGQPRPCFGGHVISAIIGVCITRLFQLSPYFDSLQWLAGALSMAVALVVMQLTGTVHPPGGKY
ncbi:unnamed protein product [Umbelopsis sp. WA50703]